MQTELQQEARMLKQLCEHLKAQREFAAAAYGGVQRNGRTRAGGLSHHQLHQSPGSAAAKATDREHNTAA